MCTHVRVVLLLGKPVQIEQLVVDEPLHLEGRGDGLQPAPPVSRVQSLPNRKRFKE